MVKNIKNWFMLVLCILINSVIIFCMAYPIFKAQTTHNAWWLLLWIPEFILSCIMVANSDPPIKTNRE
jgi:hypothetical protein